MVAATELTADGEYEFTLRVVARVVKHHDSHGECYCLELDRRDYAEPRFLPVDADEIMVASRVRSPALG